MVTDGDNHFTIYTNVESLCCRCETNTILYVNYTSIKKILNNKKQYMSVFL